MLYYGILIIYWREVIAITPKESSQFNARLSSHIKDILQVEAEKANMTMTEYLERLIEGTLPDRLEAKMEAIRQEIRELKELKEK